MDCYNIPYTHIPQMAPLFTDYLYDYGRVGQFFPYPPFEQSSFDAAARCLQYSDELRRAVVAVLREHNQQLGGGETVSESLRKLEQPGCLAVVTGQQVGLFSGPAFALYKALTAVKLARELSSRGLEAVPIFWLATEDHDLNEVNHCFVQDREGSPQRLEYADPPAVSDAPVGSVRFAESIRGLVEQLRAHLPDTEASRELIETLGECYRPGENFGSAFG
ncbi:MAG: bacillithiol biosynthesis BshC, partial [Acidobacteria bacterium]|nr:bacillithiol biosynthesis BshC [Acidobacteriota bacterium]